MEALITVTRNPNLMPNIEAAIARGVALGVEKVAVVGVTKVQEKTPVASGILVAAEQSLTRDLGAALPGMGGIGIQATIFAGPPADVYAAPVETGAVPHFPPPAALLLWVMKRFQPETDKEALSIAWAVAKNIAKRGTKGAHMFQQGYEELLALAPDIIEAEIARELEAVNHGAL
jgi:hypothetical protein